MSCESVFNNSLKKNSLFFVLSNCNSLLMSMYSSLSLDLRIKLWILWKVLIGGMGSIVWKFQHWIGGWQCHSYVDKRERGDFVKQS